MNLRRGGWITTRFVGSRGSTAPAGKGPGSAETIAAVPGSRSLRRIVFGTLTRHDLAGIPITAIAAVAVALTSMPSSTPLARTQSRRGHGRSRARHGTAETAAEATGHRRHTEPRYGNPTNRRRLRGAERPRPH